MKKKNNNNLYIYQPMYPNAASPRYYAQKALNIITAIASGTGFLTVLLFVFLL